MSAVAEAAATGQPAGSEPFHFLYANIKGARRTTCRTTKYKEADNVASGVSVLNFDRTYCAQLRLQQTGYEWIHLLDLEGVRGYCTMESLRRINERIAKRRARDITLLGSGQYHYVSLLLLAEILQPFTLILFDRHTDMMQSPASNVISCGSWARTAIRRLPLLKKVVLLGLSDGAAGLVPGSLRPRVAHFTYRRIASANVLDRVLREIPTEAVYISIDKDVLSPRDALTDWGQGHLGLGHVIEIGNALSRHHKIVGVDICGEYPSSPTTRFTQQSRRAARLNERANLLLIEAACRWLGKKALSNAAG